MFKFENYSNLKNVLKKLFKLEKFQNQKLFELEKCSDFKNT
jgi:hypothetical protein